MNKKTLFCLLAFNLFAIEKSFADINCQESSLKKSIHSVFYNQNQKNLWISASAEANEIFTALGLQKIAKDGPFPTQIKDKTITNSLACKINPAFLKTYQSRDFASDVVNACEEQRIVSLGFKQLDRTENYGSMESGYPLTWDKIGLCTDGKGLYHCAQPSLEMQQCIKKAGEVLLSPPYGLSERHPTALKKATSSKAKRSKATRSN